MAKKILIVDDSVTTLHQLYLFLEGHGFEVLKAANADEGLAIVGSQQLDLLIVDVNMPGMNGLEMIRLVRATKGYEETPCFILTSESTRALIDMGKKAGVTAWIMKPFKQELLLRGIRKVLGIEGS